ncbi:hypothetical protein CEXT_214771 [Caerostris extrusa]|uniref:Uncharacterized protein n=1 Tax=Caerostris extrusa TaxID=172846 RepID=A0AAV4YB41_CAEEX|nr:hypothetical protein CEXT_214771 [Caerostris extrusa]
MRFEFYVLLEWDEIRSWCIVMQMEKCLGKLGKRSRHSQSLILPHCVISLQQQGRFDLKDPYQLVGNYQRPNSTLYVHRPSPSNKSHSPLNRELRNRQGMNSVISKIYLVRFEITFSWNGMKFRQLQLEVGAL